MDDSDFDPRAASRQRGDAAHASADQAGTSSPPSEDSRASGYGQGQRRGSGYSAIPVDDVAGPHQPNEQSQAPLNADGNIQGVGDYETRPSTQAQETDPLYPPAPPGYYARGEPSRLFNFGRFVAVALAVGFSCAAVSALIDATTPPPGGETGRSEREVADAVLGAMDRSADPCEDFYEYACGSWIRANKIPRDRSVYQKSFSVLADDILERTRSLLENDLQRSDSKAGRFYASCIDSAATGGVKPAPLYRYRPQIAEIESSRDFAFALGVLHSNHSAGMFDVDVGVDEGEPTRYALYIGQGGLGLPSKEDYSSTTERSVKIRAAYVKEIEKMLDAAGKARLIPRFGHAELAQRVLEFEARIAAFTLPPAELRDPFKVYNKFALQDLPAGLSFETYLEGAHIDIEALNGTVIVDVPEYFDKIAEMMIQIDHDVDWLRTARAYLTLHLVRRYASLGMLGEQLFHVHFSTRQVLSGVQQLEPRWKFCLRKTNGFVGDIVGAAYVDHYFSNDRMKVAVDLSDKIVAAFLANLDRQEWMDLKTRDAAKEKLKKVGVKIGYSKKLDTFDDVVIASREYSNNIAAVDVHTWFKSIRRLGGPIDETEWFMLPHEVNAYYSPPRNEIVLPAGILQQPFFSDAYPAAMNYGSMGSVIGHELSHGEDDAGRKYDGDGRLHQWWTQSAADEYDRRAKCYIEQYDQYKPRELDIHLKGNLTLGENLADINGLKVSYRAFREFEESKNTTSRGLDVPTHVRNNAAVVESMHDPPPNKVLARELSNKQLFFVAFAQNYCMLARKEALEQWMKTDPHSIGRFRVQGALTQTKEFADAFQCKDGSKYNPESRCDLWL